MYLEQAYRGKTSLPGIKQEDIIPYRKILDTDDTSRHPEFYDNRVGNSGHFHAIFLFIKSSGCHPLQNGPSNILRILTVAAAAAAAARHCARTALPTVSDRNSLDRPSSSTTSSISTVGWKMYQMIVVLHLLDQWESVMGVFIK
ncbi:hypothetical protein NQ318_003889 [Aromia moschata]|uniref:Uncharacterized protein n=1 Tax=Aromia moschata TaxID=1265417 RepID=A0AAV8Z7S6_9CUCU|nr:hypothetical protein NQ318_003889 [Aromia moschata]